MPYDWNDDARRAVQCRAIADAIAAGLADRPGARLSIVWSAGRAGFSATEDDAAAELARYREVLDLAGELAGRFAGARTAFHLVSSAGGLFEGSVSVDPRSAPSPRRPYGRLKARQEDLLLASRAPMAKVVYRLGSVYGPPRAGRMGLIPTLLDNGIHGRVSSIYGHLTTLRDYVSSEDVGRFIAAQIDAEPPAEPAFHTLVSGRPASIFEIKQCVEKALGKRIYLSLRFDPVNERHITFSGQLRPTGWRVTDLEVGIRKEARPLYSNGQPRAASAGQVRSRSERIASRAATGQSMPSAGSFHSRPRSCAGE